MFNSITGKWEKQFRIFEETIKNISKIETSSSDKKKRKLKQRKNTPLNKFQLGTKNF
jgi:hypothetical protein